MKHHKHFRESMSEHHRARVSALHAASGQYMIHETALGITLMILVTIAGQEIAHLVNATAALTVMATSVASVLAGYR